MNFFSRLVSGTLLLMSLGTVHASSLSDAAQQLKPGESLRFDTQLLGHLLSPEEDGSNFLQWASSGVWDPVRKEIRFIGKRDGSKAPYRFLTYKVDSDSWNIERDVPIPVGAFGHGYDHNAADPRTGDHYFRKYNSEEILRWDGTWSSLPDMPESSSVAATISWFDGLGLVYADRGVIQYFDGSSWKQIESSPPNFGLHVASEYNPLAKVMIIGGGNDLPNGVLRLNERLELNQGAEAPFNLGSSSSAAVLTADPTSKSFIAWSKSEKTWAEYDIEADRWSILARSVGDGSTPQIGTPNLSDGTRAQATIGIPVDSLGILMFIQFIADGDTPAEVWLYRHSSDNRVPRPEPPTLE